MFERTWMKKTCELCPFSRSNTLWLHPERAEEFASMASNPYNDFPCHKTADYQEETEYTDGGYVHGERSFTCCGFLSLQVNENGRGPKGFDPSPNAFDDWHDMVDHHTEKYMSDHPEYEPT